MALESVPTCTSTLPVMPKWSTDPRPLRPSTPEAWASSTIMMAPYLSASAANLSTGPMSPSMREDAVGDHQLAARLAGNFLEQLLAVGHVLVAEDLDLGPRQARAVDDAGVVQLVGEDEVVLAQDGADRRRRWP